MNTQDNVKTNILKDKIFKMVIIIFGTISIIPLILILYYIIANGIPYISGKFFVQTSPAPQAEADIIIEGLKVGGISNALVGTLLIVLVAALIAIPLGIAVGVYLAENRKSKLTDIAHVAVDMIQGVPSIVFGIVVSIWIVKTFKSFSAISGSIALALMMIPIIIKNTEETIKLVPHSIREAGLALGVPYYKVILKIIIPSSLSGIVTGAIVGVSRILGETAPLLFTAFGSRFLEWNIAEPMETLPTLIYKNSLSPNSNLIYNSWGASLVLVIMVLLLNLIVKMVVNKWKVKF